MEEEIISPLFFEKILLKFLFHDVDVREKILPFLSEEIFDDFSVRQNIKTIIDFKEKHSSFPTIPEMKMELKSKDSYDVLFESLDIDISEYNQDYILERIEDFFKRKMILNELTDAVSKLKDEDIETLSDTPDKIRDKMSFSFNTDVGLNVFSDKGSQRFFDHLHQRDIVVTTGIPYFDKIIAGGFHEKTLNLYLSDTGRGKTLTMCSLAASTLFQNKNVLYLTLEMSEEKITERILANLFDVDISHLPYMTKEAFISKMKSLSKFNDKLIIKEFPPKSLNANRIRNLVKELKVKRKFKADIIFVDYLGLMIPINVKGVANSYEALKVVSEELRGIAVEESCPIVSAVQTNRGGMNSASIDLTDIADSIGITATADLIIGIVQTDEFKEAGKFCWLVLKNRYGINGYKVNVCVDYSKMRIFADENEEQNFNENKTPSTTTLVDDVAVEVIKSIKTEKKKRIADISGIEM